MKTAISRADAGADPLDKTPAPLFVATGLGSANEGSKVTPEGIRIVAPNEVRASALLGSLDGVDGHVFAEDGVHEVHVFLDIRTAAALSIRASGRREHAGAAEGPRPCPFERFTTSSGGPAVDLEVLCRRRFASISLQPRRRSLSSSVSTISVPPRLDDLLRSTDSEDVIVDLTEARFVDSTTLSIVVTSAKRMDGGRRRLLVVAGNPMVARLFGISGLDRALSVQRSLADAIEGALRHTVGVGDGDAGSKAATDGQDRQSR